MRMVGRVEPETNRLLTRIVQPIKKWKATPNGLGTIFFFLALSPTMHKLKTQFDHCLRFIMCEKKDNCISLL